MKGTRQITVIFIAGLVLFSWLIFCEASPTPSTNEYETIELTNPIRLKPVSDLYPYETILKLIISVKLPSFDASPANEASALKSVYSRVKEEIAANIDQVTADISHPKQMPSFVPVQDAPVNSILAQMSDSILGTEELMRSYINILEENDLPGFCVSLVNCSDFDTRMTEALANIMKEGQEQVKVKVENEALDSQSPQKFQQQLLETILNQTASDSVNGYREPRPLPLNGEKISKMAQILQNNYKEAVSSCQERKLPSGLVENLKRALMDIYQSPSSSNSDPENDQDDDRPKTKTETEGHRIRLPHGYKMNLSPEKFHLYTNQTLTDCLFTDKNIYVVVNIPLVRQQSKWQIYQSFHSKFIFDEKVCSIGGGSSRHSKLYGFDKINDNTVELSHRRSRSTCQYHNHHDHNYNNQNPENQLCFIPQNYNQDHHVKNSKTADSFTCASGILNKVPLKDLKSMCEFKCQNIDEESNRLNQYFEQFSKNQILLSNVRQLRVACPQFKFRKNFERIGALKITLYSCDCFVWADDQLYSFRCDDRDGAPVHTNGTTNYSDTESDHSQEDDDRGTELFEEYDQGDRDHADAIDEDKKEVDIAYLIPITWTKNTKYNMLVEDNISFKIKNHKEIIDFDWNKKSNGDEFQGAGAKYWNFFNDDYSIL